MSSNKLLDSSIKLTTTYLAEFPRHAAKGAETREKQIANIKKAYSKIIEPNKPTTKPDYLVSELLEYLFNYEKVKRKSYQIQYNNQKQVEMMIGELLEKYITSIGKDYGWVFTAQCIKAVDLLKKEKKKWITLQIKNSDNTENSSASKIREGTQILKWFRRFSKPRLIKPKLNKNGTLSKKPFGKNYRYEFEKRQKTLDLSEFYTPEFNWENFPDHDIRSRVSEEGFKKYIFHYLGS